MKKLPAILLLSVSMNTIYAMDTSALPGESLTSSVITAPLAVRSSADVLEGYPLVDPAGQFILAQAYQNGQMGLPVDYSKALHLYKIAADNGYSEAQFIFADAHQFAKMGLLVDYENYNIALKYYNLALAQGNTNAKLAMACALANGEMRLDVNYIKALELFNEAAAEGNYEAYYYLGRAYVYAEMGLKKDVSEGIRLLDKANDKGVSKAADLLREIALENRRQEEARREQERREEFLRIKEYQRRTAEQRLAAARRDDELWRERLRAKAARFPYGHPI